MPSVVQLGLGDGRSIVPLGQLAFNSDQQRRLELQLQDVLGGHHAVPADFGTPATDFLQVRLMHQFLSNAPADPVTGHRPKLPPQKMPDIDFHKAVAGLGQYPQLMRALGLVIDLEVPLGGRTSFVSRAGASQSRRTRADDSLDGIHIERAQ